MLVGGKVGQVKLFDLGRLLHTLPWTSGLDDLRRLAYLWSLGNAWYEHAYSLLRLFFGHNLVFTCRRRIIWWRCTTDRFFFHDMGVRRWCVTNKSWMATALEAHDVGFIVVLLVVWLGGLWIYRRTTSTIVVAAVPLRFRRRAHGFQAHNVFDRNDAFGTDWNCTGSTSRLLDIEDAEEWATRLRRIFPAIILSFLLIWILFRSGWSDSK